MRFLWIAGLVLVLDQLTKHLATGHLLPYVPLEVMPFVNFTLMFNTGAAFSLLADAGGWQRWLFALIAVVVSGVILWWLKRLPADHRWLAVALTLILGGALGNVWDRIVLGYVVDFIDVYYSAQQCLPFFVRVLNPMPQCHWPAFNIADSAITVGAALLVWEGLFGGRRTADEKTNGQD